MNRSAVLVGCLAFLLQAGSSGADWREDADRGIERHRKSDVRLRLVDGEGKALAGARVAVRQLRSSFGFGAAITGRLLEEPRYQQFVKEHFDWAVFGNESKWYANEAVRGQLTYETADALLDWCEANGIAVRGHTVFWEPERWQPRWVRELEGEELRAAVESRLESAVTHFAGRFRHWDVLNEPLHGSFFKDRLGADVWRWMFQRTRELDPQVTLFINEFNVLSRDKDFDAVETEAYAAQVRALLEAGAPIQGVGVQGHVWFPEVLEEPEQVAARLDAVAELGLPIWISEFDAADPDPGVNADILELVYRSAFAHPSVEGIAAWVVWAGDSWRGPDAGFAKLDWTLSEAGRRYLALKEEWSTSVEGATDAAGRMSFRGFHGGYEAALERDGRSVQLPFDVLPDGPEELVLRLPGPGFP
jgi:GH35 family endo-1,4-beta-xylanase